MSKLTSFAKKAWQTKSGKIAASALALSTLTGTYMGTEGGLTPLNTVKTGNSYGINIGFLTTLEKDATHYGLNISVGTYFRGGRINGLSTGLASGPYSDDVSPNGSHFIRDDLENAGGVNGLEIGILAIDTSGARNDNGVLANLIVNQTGDSNAFQFGVYNDSGNSDVGVKRSLLFNYDSKEEQSK